MGAAVNIVYVDVKLRTACVKISQASLRLNTTKPGNEASYVLPSHELKHLHINPFASENIRTDSRIREIQTLMPFN